MSAHVSLQIEFAVRDAHGSERRGPQDRAASRVRRRRARCAPVLVGAAGLLGVIVGESKLARRGASRSAVDRAAGLARHDLGRGRASARAGRRSGSRCSAIRPRPATASTATGTPRPPSWPSASPTHRPPAGAHHQRRRRRRRVARPAPRRSTRWAPARARPRRHHDRRERRHRTASSRPSAVPFLETPCADCAPSAPRSSSAPAPTSARSARCPAAAPLRPPAVAPDGARADHRGGRGRRPHRVARRHARPAVRHAARAVQRRPVPPVRGRVRRGGRGDAAVGPGRARAGHPARSASTFITRRSEAAWRRRPRRRPPARAPRSRRPSSGGAACEPARHVGPAAPPAPAPPVHVLARGGRAAADGRRRLTTAPYRVAPSRRHHRR